MKTTVCSITELKTNNSALLDDVMQGLELHTKGEGIVNTIKRRVIEFLNELRDDLKIIIESDYVDRDYRDSYYSFFSTKLLPYSRNCVRLSFFTSALPETVCPGDMDVIRREYLGFVVLRPLMKCIGRNVLSPKAKTGNAATSLICRVKVNATCMGVKVVAEGFPHASQDGETMTCAQTTIWSLLEYFGNRYVDYVPALPSKIKEILAPFSYERQLPSSGLSFQQISVALRELGFGTKVYMAPIPPNNPTQDELNAFNEAKSLFKEALFCYLESGIPLALCMHNGSFGHAVVAIGRIDTPRTDVVIGKSFLSQGKKCYLWNLSSDKLVLNDDNFPCYQVTSYDDPAEYYLRNHSDSWAGMAITHFIAPLYNKIYMDANVAIQASKYIADSILRIPEDRVLRTFLTSSRTYREYLSANVSLTIRQKEALLSFTMPKFVWITEITTIDDFRNNMVHEVIVIDATAGKSIRNLSSIIYIFAGLEIYLFNKKDNKFVKTGVAMPQMIEAFKGNLK